MATGIDYQKQGAGLATLPAGAQTPQAIYDYFRSGISAAAAGGAGIPEAAYLRTPAQKAAADGIFAQQGLQSFLLSQVENGNMSRADLDAIMRSFTDPRGMAALTPSQVQQVVNSRDWMIREQARGNLQGGGGLGGLIMKAAPTIMGIVSGNPLAGAIAGGAQGGIANDGDLLGIVKGAAGGAAGGYAGSKVFGGGAPNPNAVPGASTGVTTPVGGGAITGSGTAAGGGAAAGAGAGTTAGGSVIDKLVAAIKGTAPGQAAAGAVSGGSNLLDLIKDYGVPAAQLGVAGAGLLGMGASGDMDDALAASALAEKNRQAARAAGVSNAEAAFADQGDFYNRLRNSIFGYHREGLEEELGNQSRELKFELARRGHLGGSQELDNTADLTRLHNKGLLRASGIADTAVNQARAGDQAAKAAAIRDINLDVDSGSAIANAAAQSQIAAQNASDFARGQDVGDVFNSLGYLYQQGQQAKERKRAVTDYGRSRGGIAPGPASSASGYIT